MPKPAQPTPAAPAAPSPAPASVAQPAAPLAIHCRATPDAIVFADGLTLRAAPVAFATLDEKARSVDATIATEAPVEVYDWGRGEIVREILLMAGAEIPPSRQVPMLDAHDRWSGCSGVIGSTRDLRVEGPALVGRNVYADTDPADAVWRLVRAGHITDNSIGYRVRAATVIEPGQSATINGTTYSAPANQALRLATAWRLAENSNCPIGADPLAKMRAAAQPGPVPAAAPAAAALTLSLTQPLTQGSRTMEAPTPQPAAPPPAPVIDTEARAQLEALRQDLANSRRVETIRAECAQHGLPQDQIEKLIKDNATVELARGACLDHLRAARPQPGAPSLNLLAPDLKREDIAAALVLRAGQRALAEKHFGAKVCEIAERHCRNLTLMDATRQALSLANVDVRGLDTDETIRAGFSTGTLPYILGNAAHKFLLEGFGSQPATWRRIARIIAVADFKAQELLRMQDAGDLEEVPGEGEVPYSTRSEDREQLKARTYAKNFGVSRQDIINDDLGVFTDVPRLHGVRAAKRISKLTWAHVMSNPTMNDGVAFFHSTHSNLNTSHALAPDTLATAIKGFRNQTDRNGDPCDVGPAVLAVPSTLEELGRQLCLSDIILPYGGTSGTTRKPVKNVWADGSLACLVEPRLETAAYTGYATDAWYLFADPAELAAIVVGFLNGREEPVIERFDMGADRFGVVFRVAIDAGVRVAEYRAASKQTA
jgi:hypothetical protein